MVDKRKKISEEGWERIKETMKDEPEVGVEFEGPHGHFWVLSEVPTKYLVRGLRDIVEELEKRHPIQGSEKEK